MEKNGKSKLIITLLIILIIAILAFGGYFVYRDLSKNKDDISENNSKSYITDFSVLPTKSDESAKELTFNNVSDYFTTNELKNGILEKKLDLLGINFNFNVKNGTFDGEKCYTISGKVDSLLDIYPFDTCDGGCSTITKVIKTDKYYIVALENGCDGSGEIELYDKNGKKVYTIDKAVTPSGIVVVDNVLYFNLSTYPTFWNSYIDLSKDNFNVVKVKEFADEH